MFGGKDKVKMFLLYFVQQIVNSNWMPKMYIAMNRFKIVIGSEIAFEEIWKARETHLDNVSGFLEFYLVKGAAEDTHTLYASHSTWKSQNDFVNWTKSEAFRDAHKRAGEHSEIYLGHPVFEGFEVIPL